MASRTIASARARRSGSRRASCCRRSRWRAASRARPPRRRRASISAVRWLVLVLAVLLVAAATRLLTDGDPLPPVAAAPQSVQAPAPPLPAEVAPALGEQRAAQDAPVAPAPDAQRATTSPADSGPGATFLVVDEAGDPVAQATVLAIAGERDLASARTDA